MAVITLPTAPGGFERIAGVPVIKPKAEARSPYSAYSTVHVWPGEHWAFSFELPPLDRTTGLLWIKALRDLEVAADTFTLDMSNYLPSGTSGAATFSMTLVRGSAQWTVEKDGLYRISFRGQKSQ
jgi:hypothetical protein